MNTERTVINNKDGASSRLVELLLQPYDELAEVNLNTDEMLNLKHTEGKYFVPRFDGGFKEQFLRAVEYMVHPDDREEYLREYDPETIRRKLRDSANGGETRFRFRYKLANGNWRWVEQISVGGPGSGLEDGVYYSFLVDVQNEEDRDGCGEDGAETVGRNALTGLMREEEFFAAANRILDANRDSWCMISIDIEHFKLFNEWYDRSRGDQLLAQIGAKLTRVEKNTGGCACYFGQDDFALLAPYDRDHVEHLFDELHGLIKNCGTTVGFMPAFGVGVADGCRAEELYDRAAMASRRAKDDYRNRIRLFEPEMYEKTDHDYKLLSDFQKGLRDHEIYFQLQPQCQINTEKVVGAESLVRWQKAGGEQVSPGLFVPVLEQYGFITDLDKYVWEEVCIWQRKWIDKGRMPLPVSVNVSQMDIFTLDVPEYFAGLIHRYDLPTDVLKIEITESAYVDNDKVADTVRRLRENGFRVLMDDFGSGYSSLNMLKSLNVDIIKLDAKFLRMSGSDRKGEHIMESIVNMARTMGVPIIVEGVETREESEFLESLGCSYVQGYLFYRPMPVEDYEELIADPVRVDVSGFRFKVREQLHTRELLDQGVFSDTVLNNILGPVAFYRRSGERVDITRFNQQFCDEVKQHLPRRVEGIQRFLAPGETRRLNAMLDHAKKDPLSGSSGELEIIRPSGESARFRLQFFFLDEDGDGERFYGSLRDVTGYVELTDSLRLLAHVIPDTIVFAVEVTEARRFRLALHGLQETLCLTRERLQKELDDGSFFNRAEGEAKERLKAVFFGEGVGNGEFSAPIPLRNARGKTVMLLARSTSVDDSASGVKRVITLRASE
ncbi:MAG: EAL domain-containing protein [Oscillospiraceae bacterium]|nr:EAL domain-containing protein [Oscillospiraceae bacterium]